MHTSGVKALDFTEFRNNASAVLDEVEAGKAVEICRHGKVIAKIIPASGPQRSPAWKTRGLRLVVKGLSLSDAILNEREEE